MNQVELKIEYKYGHDGWLRISATPFHVFVVQCPSRDEAIHRCIALACAFGSAVNTPEGCSRHILLRPTFPIPPSFRTLCEEYVTIQPYTLLEIAETTGLWSQPQEIFGSEKALLLSGGKDSVFALRNALKDAPKDPINCIYVVGSAANLEFLDEYPLAATAAKQAGQPFHRLEAHVGSYSSLGLNIRLRSIWRELLLISMARPFGSNILTGITYEAALHDSKTNLSKVPGAFMNFAISRPGLLYLEEALDCSVQIIATSEYQTFCYTRGWKDIRGCFNPLGPCDVEGNWADACGKCRTHHVYKHLADGKPLTHHEIEFVASKYWVGDYLIRENILNGRHPLADVDGVASSGRTLDKLPDPESPT